MSLAKKANPLNSRLSKIRVLRGSDGTSLNRQSSSAKDIRVTPKANENDTKTTHEANDGKGKTPKGNFSFEKLKNRWRAQEVVFDFFTFQMKGYLSFFGDVFNPEEFVVK